MHLLDCVTYLHDCTTARLRTHAGQDSMQTMQSHSYESESHERSSMWVEHKREVDMSRRQHRLLDLPLDDDAMQQKLVVSQILESISHQKKGQF